ncbi:MAG: prolyl oligopeptidase family serine peptidase [Acholeplasmataceae bacterium]|nr:prolyl oligopeptidase family serine peptidase [Acholeplasmataceae bacterium]
MKIKLESKNYIDLHLLDQEIRDVVLIFPGGGYERTSSREAEPVRDVFLKEGYHTAIYYYREEKLIYPQINIEGQKAIEILKNNPFIRKIFLIGFSAGGHFAIMLASLYPELIQGTILAYPVVSSDKTIYHGGSMRNLLGTNLTEETWEAVSIEKQVNSKMSPVFIMHTMDDSSVPVENSIRLIQALNKHQIYTESHFYPKGNHGVSLATKEVSFEEMNPDEFVEKFGYISSWIHLAKDFLRRIKS